MPEQDTLISVRFGGYCLEIRMSLTSLIGEVVQILKQNDFLPSDIPSANLAFFARNRKRVQANQKVESLIQKNENKATCQLLVQECQEPVVKPKQQEQNDFQTQVYQYLKRTADCLKSRELETLTSAPNNPRIESRTGTCLAQIGQCFSDLINEKSFFQKALHSFQETINNNGSINQCEINCSRHQDFVQGNEKSMAYSLSKKIVEMIRREQTLKREKGILQSQLQQLKNQKNQLDSVSKLQIKNLENQLKETQTKIKKLQNQLKTQKQTNIAKSKELKETIEKQLSDIQNLKQENQLLLQKIQASQELNRELQMNLDNQKQEVKSLKQRIQSIMQTLDQKEKLLLKYKEDDYDDEISQFLQNIQTTKINQQPLILTIQNIFNSSNLEKSLRTIIATQMKKQIKSLHHIYSFDIDHFQRYQSGQYIMKKLINKKSLLFIGSSATEDKVFGAFTEEKFQNGPEKYQFKQFKGCSFLFTMINNNIEHFNIIDGQKSLNYDLNYLVFGDDDLTVDFLRNKCSSEFVKGRQSLTFKSLPASSVSGKSLINDSKMSKRLISDMQNDECQLKQYCIYEVQFVEKNKP